MISVVKSAMRSIERAPVAPHVVREDRLPDRGPQADAGASRRRCRGRCGGRRAGAGRTRRRSAARRIGGGRARGGEKVLDVAREAGGRMPTLAGAAGSASMRRVEVVLVAVEEPIDDRRSRRAQPSARRRPLRQPAGELRARVSRAPAARPRGRRLAGCPRRATRYRRRRSGAERTRARRRCAREGTGCSTPVWRSLPPASAPRVCHQPHRSATVHGLYFFGVHAVRGH